MSIELKPCPFCGGSDFEIVENGRIWSGMKYSEPVSVGVRHWCPATPGQPSRMIERVGRDEASAVTAWNTRHTLSQQPATQHPRGCGFCDHELYAATKCPVCGRETQPATGEPVQADSSEHLRVIASLGAALRRLSFAAQTTGGTDGPDAELQSAIGQAEQALSLGGIWQAMSATPEPVKAAPYNPTEEMRWAMKRIDPALSSDQCRALWSAAWSAAPSAHPAPIVPDDVVRDAAQEAVEELHKLNEYAIVYINDPEWTRVSDTCQKLIGSIEKAMLAAAQAQKGGA